ncbi:MAG: pyridoxal 5'-phosphate synthase glutaminase subunit PdxT [Candidatus Thermoplasmatota archaeon]
MVNKIYIGIIGIQGAISEHKTVLEKTYQEMGIKGSTLIVRNKSNIEKIEGLIIPGGESSTISKVLKKNKMQEQLSKKITDNDLPVMGTCAGSIILAKKTFEENKKIHQLKVMNMKVKRNAFGRQSSSFEKKINIDLFKKPYPAVFIRAPSIVKVWGKCKPLASIKDKIVMAKQNKKIAISFHPELTHDTRIHRYFLNQCQ